MAYSWRLSETGALLIYLILITGCIAVVLAYKLLPQSASEIRIYNLNRELVGEYHRGDSGGLYYRTSSDSLTVFSNEMRIIFPYNSCYRFEIRP